MKAILQVTVLDLETGKEETVKVGENDYFIVCTGKCYLAHAQAYGNGTHVLTIKGRAPGVSVPVEVPQAEDPPA